MTQHLYPQRKSIHLKSAIYDQNGSYFITICTKGKEKLFGTIEDDILKPTKLGLVVSSIITQMREQYHGLSIPYFVVMPNHVHFLIQRERSARGKIISLANFIRKFKASCSMQWGNPIWQRGYYDHVIRTEQDRLQIIEYIQNNPRKWELDQEYIEG